MGFESWPSFKKSSKIPKEETTARAQGSNIDQGAQEIQPESDMSKRTRAQLDSFFDEYKDPKARMEEILKKIKPFFKHIDKKILPAEKADEIIAALSACENLSDKQQFLDKIMEALRPVLDIRQAHADEFEDAQARAMNEAGGFTEINRLLSYGKYKHIIHMHAPAGETVGNKITLYRDGMRKLAEIINNDPEIKEITATSPLVAAHPGLFTRAGFKVEEVSDEFRQQHFSGEEREIKKAIIDREEFLRRFLKKDKSPNQ
jgi:hypothetical protein